MDGKGFATVQDDAKLIAKEKVCFLCVGLYMYRKICHNEKKNTLYCLSLKDTAEQANLLK